MLDSYLVKTGRSFTVAVGLAAMVLAGSTATASAQASVDVGQSLAIWRVDALGIDAEIVARLESLLRQELERMTGKAMPSRSEMDRALRKSRRLRACSGETKCLARIGKVLGVDLVISGQVAALGDSYVINLKVVDVASKKEIRRIASDPLRGSPDDLIETVRIAAYRLVAPEALLGSVAVLTDLLGATVYLDGNKVGMTPLQEPLSGLGLGEHTLRVTAKDYSPFEEKVRVRFQKTTRVVVRFVLADPVRRSPVGPLGPVGPAEADKRWYNSTWFYVAAGVTAVVIGGYVGYRLARDPVTDCSADPMACN